MKKEWLFAGPSCSVLSICQYLLLYFCNYFILFFLTIRFVLTDYLKLLWWQRIYLCKYLSIFWRTLISMKSWKRLVKKYREYSFYTHLVIILWMRNCICNSVYWEILLFCLSGGKLKLDSSVFSAFFNISIFCFQF